MAQYNPTTDDPRSLAGVGVDLLQDLRQLRAGLQAQGVAAGEASEHDWATMEATIDREIDQLSADRSVGGQHAPAAHHFNHDAQDRTLLDVATRASTNAVQLIDGLTHAGVPVSPQTRETVEKIHDIAVVLAGRRHDLATAPAVPFQVPGAKANTSELSGTRPGEKPTSLDVAGRALERQLTEQNGRPVHFSPVDKLADDIAVRAAPRHEQDDARLAELRGRHVHTGPQPYEPPTEYVPPNWRRK